MANQDFCKEFPSLKGKVVEYKDISFRFIDSMVEPKSTGESDKLFHSKWVWEKRIQEHCLDKSRVRDIISNIKPKKWKENNRCFTDKELEVYTKSSHQFGESMAIFVLSEIERYIERIERELNLGGKDE